MRNIYLLSCLALMAAGTVKAQVDGLDEILQDILDNQVNILGHHGVSACVIMPLGDVWKGQAGVDESGNAITEETLFIGASTTKTHLATLFLLYQEEGLVDLDDTWTEHVTLPIAIDPSITIRHLLSHTSGIDDYLESQENEDLWLDPGHAYTASEILTDFVPELALFSPGTDFYYSNSNYVILGKMAEAITGNTLAAELRERIWDPLQLNHTWLGGFENYTGPFAGIWWNFGQGVTPYNDIPHSAMFTYGFGAGNVLTTPTDEAHFLHALINGELISSASLYEMTSFVPWSFTSWTNGYGLGLHHANVGIGDEVLGHDGYYLNLTSMFHSMQYGFTVVTMTNTQQGWFGIFNPMYEEISNWVGVESLGKMEREMFVYPSPTSGDFTVECSSASLANYVEVVDVFGRVIHQTTIQGQITKLDLELDPGIYFVRTDTGFSQSLVVE